MLVRFLCKTKTSRRLQLRVPITTVSVSVKRCFGTGSSTNRTMATPMKKPFIVMDEFCLRQFSQEGQPPFIPITADEFTTNANEEYEKELKSCKDKNQGTESILKEGYAPFCKHLFIPTWFEIAQSYVQITDDNRHLLRSDYFARTEKELPVLQRSFPAGSVEVPMATWLDVILYSRKQVELENAAMSKQEVTSTSRPNLPPLSQHLSSKSEELSWEWCIVSIKPQSVDHETPMTPITVMRNALGVEEGGSGQKLDRQKYLESVIFWTDHATVSNSGK